MAKESIRSEFVCFTNEKLFGDDMEHFYNVECFDGYGIATNSDKDDNAPTKLKVTYPKREEIINDKERATKVLNYNGLYDLSIKDINFADIMLCYGKLEKMK